MKRSLLLCAAVGIALVLAVACGEHASPGDRARTIELPVERARGTLPLICVDRVALPAFGGPGAAKADPHPWIVAAWDDGLVAWSADPIAGGAPYSSARVDPELVRRIACELTPAWRESSWCGAVLTGPDSGWTSIAVRCGGAWATVGSWHEEFEQVDGLVATERGVEPLDGRRRADVLAASSAEYRAFRSLWGETRARISGLVPAHGEPVAGEAFEFRRVELQR